MPSKRRWGKGWRGERGQGLASNRNDSRGRLDLAARASKRSLPRQVADAFNIIWSRQKGAAYRRKLKGIDVNQDYLGSPCAR
jgi:hypothetical protein